jgi:XTP/dITP diphosphohydrolase
LSGSAPLSFVLASNNAGKLREIGALLAPMGWEVRPQSEWGFEEAVEDGATFVENALIKARHAASHTGLPSLGDDSGLLVDALDGRPGLRSARYADGAGSKANIEKLLRELKAVPEDQRAAHFYCVMVMLRHEDDPAPLVTTGHWPGQITTAPRGDGGFGYDPVFFVPDRDATAAELSPAIKNVISHRGQALSGMIRLLRQEFPG